MAMPRKPQFGRICRRSWKKPDGTIRAGEHFGMARFEEALGVAVLVLLAGFPPLRAIAVVLDPPGGQLGDSPTRALKE